MDYYNINIIFSLWKYPNSNFLKNEAIRVLLEIRGIIKSPISVYLQKLGFSIEI